MSGELERESSKMRESEVSHLIFFFSADPFEEEGDKGDMCQRQFISVRSPLCVCPPLPRPSALSGTRILFFALLFSKSCVAKATLLEEKRVKSGGVIGSTVLRCLFLSVLTNEAEGNSTYSGPGM